MPRKLRYLAGGLLLAFPGAASAESLADAMVHAFRFSPELASQRANVNIASETAVQARAGGRPTLTGQFSFELQNERNEGFQLPTTLNLTLVQPIYTGGTVENSTTAAERRITGQEALLKDVERDILLAAVTAYLDVRRDEELVRVARNNVNVLNEQLEAAQERFEVGEVTRTDVEQARARLAASRSTLAANEGSLENSIDSYRRNVGKDPGKLLPPPPIPELPDSEAEAIALGHPDKAGETVYDAAGCHFCANRGFIGRLGVFELLSMDQSLSSLVASGADEASVVAAAREAGSLQQQARAISRIASDMADIKRYTAARALLPEASEIARQEPSDQLRL
ncbi:MAG: TolC family protein, partial [Pseudomonadota bacterium]